MQRILCVCLPSWPIDRIRWRLLRQRQQQQRGVPDEQVILLVKTDRGHEIIASCCPRARAAGVLVGMTLAHARALLPRRDIVEERFDPDGDERALQRFASWAIRYTPLVAPLSPDGLFLNMTGCQRLHRGEKRLISRIGADMARLGVTARLACASTIGCAWAVARFSSQAVSIIGAGEERSAIEPLPIESLRLDERTVEALHEVGVDRVEQLLAIPRRQLASRFGMGAINRIDQAIGIREEAVCTIPWREPLVVERCFNGPVADLETLLMASREIVHEASCMLAREETGATELHLTLERIDASPISISLRLSRTSRDRAHLWSLLRPRIESASMGYGVESITLRITSSSRIVHVQEEHWTKEATSCSVLDRAAGELIDTLTHQLGTNRVLKMSIVESHRPERAAGVFCWSQRSRTRDAGKGAEVFTQVNRPSQLLARPEPVEVMAMVPEGPPIWLRWRAGEHRITSAVGPERIAREWWMLDRDADSETSGGRDYFRIQVESGCWLWMFRALASGRWFVHGAWA